MITLVGGIKGGTGKSTTVAQIAVANARDKIDQVIIDADDQANINSWSELRADLKDVPKITVIQKTGKGLLKEIQELESRFKNVIVDAGGYDSTELRAGMVVSDILLVPVEVSQFGIDTFERLEEALRNANAVRVKPPLEAWTFVSKADFRNPDSEQKMLTDIVSDYEGFRCLNSKIILRKSFKKGESEGRGVLELLKPDKKASAEVTSLYEEIKEKFFQTQKEVFADA